MLSYNEMIGCGKKYSDAKKQMYIAKYKEFVSYLKKIILIIFKDNEEQIISYLNEINDKSFLLDWCVGEIHYDGFHIKVSESGKTLEVSSLRAHDSYYDPVLNLESFNDDDLLSFFDKEYRSFMDLFIPHYCLEDYKDNSLINESQSLVCRIAEKFNLVCFDHFKGPFLLLGINDAQSFIDSKYSLSFTDERRTELDKEVYDEYNSYCEKVDELLKKFNESVKDLK